MYRTANQHAELYRRSLENAPPLRTAVGANNDLAAEQSSIRVTNPYNEITADTLSGTLRRARKDLRNRPESQA